MLLSDSLHWRGRRRGQQGAKTRKACETEPAWFMVRSASIAFQRKRRRRRTRKECTWVMTLVILSQPQGWVIAGEHDRPDKSCNWVFLEYTRQPWSHRWGGDHKKGE
jgi:hypothetical protein